MKKAFLEYHNYQLATVSSVDEMTKPNVRTVHGVEVAGEFIFTTGAYTTKYQEIKANPNIEFYVLDFNKEKETFKQFRVHGIAKETTEISKEDYCIAYLRKYPYREDFVKNRMNYFKGEENRLFTLEMTGFIVETPGGNREQII
ncbi:hypothetical protein X560_0891 [Listeria fleischmannii 1991]|nr:pyridoxamine 5'-phosphate oxidase family protein [Listeria fleischmannii]KMT60279.1 hypothetical protein X560_0891 [Listeria fleischmannii 1991]